MIYSSGFRLLVPTVYSKTFSPCHLIRSVCYVTDTPCSPTCSTAHTHGVLISCLPVPSSQNHHQIFIERDPCVARSVIKSEKVKEPVAVPREKTDGVLCEVVRFTFTSYHKTNLHFMQVLFWARGWEWVDDIAGVCPCNDWICFPDDHLSPLVRWTSPLLPVPFCTNTNRYSNTQPQLLLYTRWAPSWNGSCFCHNTTDIWTEGGQFTGEPHVRNNLPSLHSEQSEPSLNTPVFAHFTACVCSLRRESPKICHLYGCL